MATPELIASWERTTAYLLHARSHFSADGAAEHAIDLAQVDEFIDNNELGLAFQWMDSLAEESESDYLPLLEALALAADNLKKPDRLQVLQRRIAELRKAH